MAGKIGTIGLFHTPKDWDELERWIEKHPAGDRTRIHVMTAACMGWNLAAKYAKDTEGLLTAAYTWLESYHKHGSKPLPQAELEDLGDLLDVIKEEYIGDN